MGFGAFYGGGGAAVASGFTASNNLLQGLGDSITALNTFQPINTSIADVPAWTPSTVYVTGAMVQNNGLVYYAKTGGTSAGSGGPTGTTGTITDGSVTWVYSPWGASKIGQSYLTWAEIYGLGSIVFDMSTGEIGFKNSFIDAAFSTRGSGYLSAPTVTLQNGSTATANITNGSISSFSITNPGQQTSSSITFSGGSPTVAAVASAVTGGNGAFGVPGCLVADAVLRLPRAVASRAGNFVVHVGTNDIPANTTYANIISGLKTCYETLMAAGKNVVAMCITPRSSASPLTTAQIITLLQVNDWIRAYCAGSPWANPLGYTNIALADPTVYFTDQTSLINNNVGGFSATSFGNVTVDGLHPSIRGGQIEGWCVARAMQKFVGPPPLMEARSATVADAYDPVLNPYGNLLEGYPWAGSTAYTVGQFVSNNSNVYVCITAGTSASSGGPTTTSSNITDGTAHWAYIRPAYTSVCLSANTQTVGSFQGTTPTGDICQGYTFARTNNPATLSSGQYTLTNLSTTVLCTNTANLVNGMTMVATNVPANTTISGIVANTSFVLSNAATGSTSGTAIFSSTGTVACTYESGTWSTGETGNRQVIAVSLATGGTAETMSLTIISNKTYSACGLQSSDLYNSSTNPNSPYFSAVGIFEITNMLNLRGLSFGWSGASSEYSAAVGQTGFYMLNSANDVIPIPNGGLHRFRTQPIQLPANTGSLNFQLQFEVDASTAASFTVKTNYVRLSKVRVNPDGTAS